MKDSLSFKSYLLKIGLIVLLFIYLPILFSFASGSTIGAFLASSACFWLLLNISTYLILQEKKYLRYYAIAFLLQLIIGVGHYLYFVDSSYFAGNGGATTGFWHEFLTTVSSVEMIHSNWAQNGFFSMVPTEDFYMTHREIWHIIAYPFYFLGHKWLNYAPFNIYCSLFASVNIVAMYKNKLNDNCLSYLKFWTAYFPLFVFSDWMWRDAFGILLITIGLSFLSLAKTSIEKFCAFIWLGVGSFIQRTMYLVLAGAAFGYDYIRKQRNRAVQVFTAILSIVLVYFLLQYTQEVNDESYNSGYVNSMSFIALPIKIVFGLIGPFPWIQFFDLVNKNPAFAWQLGDYVLGTFQFGYLISLIAKHKSVDFHNLDTCTVLGFGIMLSGFVTAQLHIGYIAEGLYFTLPWYFARLGSQYKRYFRISFMILIILNIVIYAIGGLSISSLWK